MNSEPAKVDLSAVVNDIRALNQEGKEWTPEIAEKISKRYCIPVEKLNDWATRIYGKYVNEFNVRQGSVIQRIEFFSTTIIALSATPFLVTCSGLR